MEILKPEWIGRYDVVSENIRNVESEYKGSDSDKERVFSVNRKYFIKAVADLRARFFIDYVDAIINNTASKTKEIKNKFDESMNAILCA